MGLNYVVTTGPFLTGTVMAGIALATDHWYAYLNDITAANWGARPWRSMPAFFREVDEPQR